MRHLIFRIVSKKRSYDYRRSGFATSSRSFSRQASDSERPSFGIAFDIDGVILLGHTPIGGSPCALKRLYDDSGSLKIPYVFLTNGGGVRESKRALELSNLLGLQILPTQVIQGHSPFKQLVSRFQDEFIIAVGKGEPAAVMSEYGFKILIDDGSLIKVVDGGADYQFQRLAVHCLIKADPDNCPISSNGSYLIHRNVLSIDEYASCFDGIDPLAQHKKWTTGQIGEQSSIPGGMVGRSNIVSRRVQAAFVVSDSVDWSRDIQVMCDVLSTGGLPGRENGQQPPLYFASDDHEYQANFPSERLGMGAFRIALEAVYNSISPSPLHYTSYGKPNPSVFGNAETVLSSLMPSVKTDAHVEKSNFKTLYMIGDNPKVDIRGARQAGIPWFSILTRTGVFKGKGNHDGFPADLVVDTVEDAVDFILRKECAA